MIKAYWYNASVHIAYKLPLPKCVTYITFYLYFKQFKVNTKFDKDFKIY